MLNDIGSPLAYISALKKLPYTLHTTQSEFTCSKLPTEILKQGVMLTYLTPCSNVSIANFEHAIAGWLPSIFEANIPH